MRWTFALWLGVCWANAAYYVPSLPDVVPEAYFPEMHAGNILLSDNGTSLFFWHVASEFQLSRPRTVLWLNGGPGCSSMDGALLEVGPFRFNDKGKLVENSHSWSKYVNLLFLDQPFGTGYSTGDGVYAQGLDGAANAVVDFLHRWLDLFPECRKHELYIAGESYAGEYIPYIYQAIQRTNKDVEDAKKIDIKGLVLGNPWIDAAHQYLSYVPFIEETGLIKNPDDLKQLKLMHRQCADSLQAAKTVMAEDPICDEISQYALSHYNGQDTCFNIYNVKLEDTYDSCGMNWPPGVEFMSGYLGRKDVRAALHAPPSDSESWEECSAAVRSHFKGSQALSAVSLLPDVLKSVPLLLLVGDRDYICNKKGLQDMVQNLNWDGATGFTGKSKPYILDGEHIGTLQSERNLTVVNLFEGSHMVPHEMPYETRAILHGFMGLADSYNTTLTLSEPPESPKDAEEKERIINAAMYRAYYQAGFVVLGIMVAVLLVVGYFSWRNNMTSSFTLRGLLNALMHFSPGRRKPALGEYVNLRNFRRRPSTILEEDLEETGGEA